MDNLALFEKLLRKLTHYNAAEGDAMRAEHAERSECRKRCLELRDTLIASGVNTDDLIKGKGYFADEILIKKKW